MQRVGSKVKEFDLSNLPKHGISMLIWFNLTQILWLSIILFVATSSIESFHVVKQPLVAIKVFSVVIAVLNFVACLQVSPTIESYRKRQIQFDKILKSCVIIFCGTAIYHIIVILFGAPVLEQMEETYNFSMLLSSATLLPSCCVLGSSHRDWFRLYINFRPENYLETNLLLTTVTSLLGAWIGAFPIPLDWDRPWQAWPVTCMVGVIIGYIVGLVLSTIHITWRKCDKRKII